MLPKQPIKGLIDGIRCLQGVVSKSEPIGVIDLARELDIDQTRAHRLLRTLAFLGFTRQNNSRKYGPGPAIYALAAQTLYASHFIRDALAPLETLRRKQPYIVAMGVYWNRSISYLYHARRGTPLERAIGTMGIWDATNSGIGMAVLAGMTDEQVRSEYEGHDIPFFDGGIDALAEQLELFREAGYGRVFPEDAVGRTTLAIALPSNPLTAVGISGRYTEQDEAELLELLRETVDQIEENAALPNGEPARNTFGKTV